MPSHWTELSTIADTTGIPRATLDCWARRDEWPSVTFNGRKMYPTKLVARRCLKWAARREAAA